MAQMYCEECQYFVAKIIFPLLTQYCLHAIEDSKLNVD